MWKSLFIVIFISLQLFAEITQERCEYIIKPLSSEQINSLKIDLDTLARQNDISIELFKINQNECEFLNYEIVVAQAKQTNKNKKFSISSLYPDKKPKINDYVRLEIPNIEDILSKINEIVKQEINKNVEITYTSDKEEN